MSTVETPPATPRCAETSRRDSRAEDLRTRSLRGAATTLGAQGCKFVLTMAATVVLARLLGPEEFGLMAMVAVVLGLVAAFGDFGLSLAVVQRDRIRPEQVSALFWISLGLHVVLAALVMGAAPLLALLYREPRVFGVTMAMATVLVVSGLGLQHQALLRRNMRFRALAIVEVGAMLGGVTAGIGLALLGAGYWSLVAMYLTQRGLETTGLWVACRWRPSRYPAGTEIRSLLRFGGFHTGFQVVNYFARNADNMLIGWFWGAGPLGLYSRAYSLLMLPLTQINTPVTAVALPMLSQLQHEPERFGRAYLQLVRTLTSITLPGVALTIVLAPEMVHLFLGSQWTAVVPVFRILGFVGLVQVTTNTTGNLLIASGRTDRMFLLGCYMTAGAVGSFLVGLRWGIEAVALAYAVFTWLSFLPLLAYVTSSTAVRVRGILRALVRPAVAAVAVAAVAIAVQAALAETAPWLRFLAVSTAGGLAWLGLHATAFRDVNPLRLVRELRNPRAA